MAKAKRISPAAPPPDVIRLELTMDEAQALRNLFYHRLANRTPGSLALRRINTALADVNVYGDYENTDFANHNDWYI